MNFRKKPIEEIPQENTDIWSCSDEGCKGWMRDNFSFDYEPACPLCLSPMAKDSKMLPIVADPNGDVKSLKKGISLQM